MLWPTWCAVNLRADEEPLAHASSDDPTIAAILARIDQTRRAVTAADLHRQRGRVIDLIGLIVEATGLEAEVGEVCEVAIDRHLTPVAGRPVLDLDRS